MSGGGPGHISVIGQRKKKERGDGEGGRNKEEGGSD